MRGDERKRPLSVAGAHDARAALPVFPGSTGRPWWRLSEPSTTLTDLAITVVATLLAVLLLRRGPAAAGGWLAAALLTTAAAAFTGALVHGVPHALGERGWRLSWRLTLQLALAANAALLAAVGIDALAGHGRATWLAAVVLKLLVFMAIVWRRYEFRWIVLDSIVTLLAVGVMQVMLLALGDHPGAPWMLGGVMVSVLAGAVQHSRIALHRHLNHNDLYHLVQIVALYLFFRGGLLLGGS